MPKVVCLMDKRQKTMLIRMALFVIGALIFGAYIDFHPFLGDDLIVREIQYCTFIICMVIAVCTTIVSKKE